MEAKVIVTTELQLKAFIADAVSAAFKYCQPKLVDTPDSEPYGDFKWLCKICPGIPASTLRIKSASGEIPGMIKVGKRALYEKERTLNWLRSQTRQPVNTALIEQQVEDQFKRQLSKKGGVRA